MDKLKDAAQQALAQLEINRTNFRKGPSKSICKMLAGGNDEVIAKLRAALAEQPAEQRSASEHMEPVATKTAGGAYDGITLHLGWDSIPGGTKLYAAPQPRREVELTDEEIDALPWGPSYDNPMTLTEGLRDFARAVIEAYKAKQGEQE